MSAPRELPPWFRQEVPDQAALGRMRELLGKGGLHTVCQSARCPNLGACWEKGTATFMILGDVCTRGCKFCAVKSGEPSMPDEHEPLLVADAVQRLGLKYVVVTSVTRDDLDDQGAFQFARTVRAIKDVNRGTRVEVLIPDLSGDKDLLRIVVESGPEVTGHNIETVKRLTPLFRSKAVYERSLQVLTRVRRMGGTLVKSGLMAGMGETDDEIVETLKDLKSAGCDIVTIGQYLAPRSEGERGAQVDRFVSPEMFEMYRQEGRRIGLKYVHAGPLVRSSYLAEQGFELCQNAGEARGDEGNG